MNIFGQKCLALRRLGHTLTEISKITGRPKSSVYGYIQNIPLDTKKLKSIKQASGIRARKLAQDRKGKSNRIFKKFNAWNKDTINIVSHFLFDGEIKKEGCIYNNRNTSLVHGVEKSMKKIYDFKPKYYFNSKTGVSRVSYFNVVLGAYMKNKSEELLREILNLPVNLKRIFLRAFFDDEGCMDYRPKRNLRRIRGYQKNNKILHLIQKLLKSFDIESSIIPPNEVVVSGKKNLQKFQEKINFSSGVKINGKRPNSIWKKSLEKRGLLDQAIRSFKT